MGLRSSHLSHVKLAGIVVPNMQYTLTAGTRLDETTQSDSGGADKACTLYGFVRQDNSWEIHVKRDDTAYPDAVGLGPGVVVPEIYFKLGTGLKADKLENTTVETNEVESDSQGKFIGVVIRGKGGARTPNADYPS